MAYLTIFFKDCFGLTIQHFWLQLDIYSVATTYKLKNLKADSQVWGDARGDQEPETFLA